MEFQHIDILLRLAIAHFLTDFPFQSRKMAEEKKKGLKSIHFYFHVLIVLLTTYILLAQWTNWQGPLVIAVVHGIIDLARISIEKKVFWARNNPKWMFIFDQGLHLTNVTIYWIVCISGVHGFHSIKLFFDQAIIGNNDMLIIIFSYLLITMPAGNLIGLITKKWQDEIERTDMKSDSASSPETESLTDAGKTIGMIERILVLTFILISQYQAIGFLIAAKSVFRFGDLKETGQRKRTEYILIGTLISFTCSIGVGLITKYLIERF